MSVSERQRWNDKYSLLEVPTQLKPDSWLVGRAIAWPPGRGLDLACGLGHNAIWLEQQGWSVDAVDISAVGLKLAARFAERQAVGTLPQVEQLQRRVRKSLPGKNLSRHRINWIEADADDWRPRSGDYDLIVVFRFLQRREVPRRIQSALRPGGRLVYETFTVEQLGRHDGHIRNPDHTLAAGELPALFPELTTVEYREVELEDRTVAQLVAQRPE